MKKGALIIFFLLSLAGYSASWAVEETIFNRPVERGGFHFQFVLGGGAGNRASGVLSILELGYTFQNDTTLMFWHPMIENDSQQEPSIAARYPNVVIGVKRPFFYRDLVFKFGFGGGGAHEPDFDNATLGVGWAYGVDLHYPVGRGHGLTLALTVHHVQLPNRHFVAASLGVGYTVF